LGGPKGRDHWEDLGVESRIILRLTLGIRLSQDGIQWRDFVSTKMKLLIS
jgi:hypothetical protein